ncbi:MAG: hypothetical protein RIB41_13255 [Oceanibaculum nanhaiense]|uniref:phage head spike fiber domain-containing protein n=1 Tax=Oceanibaculum nanhaiense TaxID=1909734 RepID=UPI0032EBEB5E
MANMILGWVNEADRAALAGGRWATALPQAALADDRLSKAARTLGNRPADTAIVADLRESATIGLAALFGAVAAPAAGCPLGSARYRVRASDDARLAGPILDLDFTSYGPEDPRIAFARSSLATRFDRTGLLQGYGLTEPLTINLDGFDPPGTLEIMLQLKERDFWVGEAVRLADPEDAARHLVGTLLTFDRESGAARLAIESVAGTGSPTIAWRLESLAARYGRRQDHDPASGTPRGFLIEGERTNLLARSAGFAESVWTKQGSIVASGGTAPDGTQDAALLREDSGTGFHQMTQSVSVAEGTIVTLSLFVKPAGRTRLALLLSSGGDYAQGTFDLAAGNASTNQGEAGTALSARLVPLADGWARCMLTGSIAGETSYLAACRLLNPGGSYEGDGTSGLLVWGAQAEAGPDASSYIPTAGGPATRAADSARLALDMSLPEGTLLAAYRSRRTGSVAIAGLNDGTADNAIELRHGASGARLGAIIAGGVEQAALSTGSPAADTASMAGIAFTAGDAASSADGGAAVTGTPGALPAFTGLDLGNRPNGETLDGHLARVQLYGRRLTDTELTGASASLALQLGPVAYDSGWLDVWQGNWRREGYAAVMLATPPDVAARYWRFDLDDQASSDGFLDLARLWLGPAVRLSVNYEYGASLGIEAEARIVRAQDGTARFEDRARLRIASYPIEHQSAQEAYRVHLELQRVAGPSGEVLAVADPDDTEFRAERVFIARLRSLRPVAHRAFQRFGTELELEERLS